MGGLTRTVNFAVKLFCMGAVTVALSFSQDTSVAPLPHGQKILPPGSIDGSKTPQLIPDAVAFELFFRATSEPPNATPQQLARQRVKIHAAKLSLEDEQGFYEVLSQFHTACANPSTDRATLPANTLAALHARLSSDGMVRLTQYIQNEKKRMTITPLSK